MINRVRRRHARGATPLAPVRTYLGRVAARFATVRARRRRRANAAVATIVGLAVVLTPLGGGSQSTRPLIVADQFHALGADATPHRSAREEAGGQAPGHEGDRGRERDLPPWLRAAKRRANARLARLMRGTRRPRARRSAAEAPSVGVVNGLNALGTPAQNGGIPGDPTGAAGPNYYVAINNNEIVVHDRATLARIRAMDVHTFPPSGGRGDVQVAWDSQSDHWFYLMMGSGLTWGFSKSDDPRDLSGGWCHYQLPTPIDYGVSSYEDFPKLGLSADHLVFSSNVLNAASFLVSARIWALAKPPTGELTVCPPLSSFHATGWGDANHPLTTTDGSTVDYPIAVRGTDTTSDAYVVSSTLTGNPGKILVWRITGPPDAPQLVTDGDGLITVGGPMSAPPDVPQGGGSTYALDTGGGWLTQAVAHTDPDAGGAEAIWTQHTIQGPSGRAVVRWYELLPGSLTARQVGVVDDANESVFNAAISPTTAGDEAVIHYDVGGPDLNPEVHARARRSATPLGGMGGELTLATSGYSGSGRWGDYVGATPDPLGGGVVWGTNETIPANSGDTWDTHNFALKPLNEPPAAAFSVAPVSPVAGDQITLSSTASDPDGQIASYAWDVNDDGVYGDAISASTSVSFAHSGSYMVGLRVTDNDGATGTATKSINVGDHPPLASFSFSPQAPLTGEQVSFSASASDPDGSVASYAWDLNDDGDYSDASGDTATTSFARPRGHTVSLRVIDDQGAQTTVSTTVIVDDRPPTAALAFSPQSPSAGQLVTFDASASSDPDGSMRSYSFDFDGDGHSDASGSGPVASYAYPAAGSYRPTVTVYDDAGASAQAGLGITVGTGSNPLAPPPFGSPLPGPRLAVSVHAPRTMKLSRALHQPPAVSVRCSLACSASGRLLLDTRSAKRVGLSGAAPVMVARGFVHLTAGTAKAMLLPVSRSLAGRLRAGQRITLTLAVAARTASGQVRVVNRTLTLRT